MAVGYFDGDGKPDLVVADVNDMVISILPGNGDGTFQLALPFVVGPADGSPQVGITGVAVANMNGDGVADLAIGSLAENIGYLCLALGKGDGTYERNGPLNFGGSQNSQFAGAVAAADFNGDGRSILAVANVLRLGCLWASRQLRRRLRSER